jgi:hypothetical protein
MLKRTLLSALTLAAIAAIPTASANAADTVVVPGVAPEHMTALDGVIVWRSGTFPNNKLMQRGADGTVGPVKGAPTAYYQSLDLGHDGNGKLVLTYIRCTGTKNCKGYSDDLAGHRNSYKKLVPAHCSLTTAPSRWLDRVAYGLECTKPSGKSRVHDAKRSGLFVRKGAGAAKHLPLPKDAKKFGIDIVHWADLRGTNVGAVVSDIYSYAFRQTVNGTHLRSDFVAASEGESDANVVGLSLAAGARLWTLVDSLHVGDPNEAAIDRINSTCADFELVKSPAGPNEQDSYPYEAMAVDGDTVYLYVPGTGIVRHDYVPTAACN